MKKEVIINGSELLNREVCHSYLKEQLELPPYYGCNLDALWDILSTWDYDVCFVVIHYQKIREYLGQYGEDLISVFLEAAEENNLIKVRLED